MNSKQILVDVDDVLLDWFSSFASYMATKGYKLDTSKSTWYLGELFGCSDEEAFENVLHFNEASSHFGELKAYEDATHVLKELHDLGFKFVAISSCSSKEEVLNLRKQNLLREFGEVFDKVFCIDCRTSKRDILSQFEPSWWIEDKLSNAEAGLDFGHKPILITRHHNKNDKVNDPIIRVNTWHEIYDIIKNNLGEKV